MPAPLAFSVVVTNYNYRAFVAEAVDSVLAQTRAPIEIIVVDDGSGDGSADFLQARYGGDSRIKLIATANHGQLAAFQRGLAHCHGELVCFLDADDRWGSDYLAQVGAMFDARQDIDFVFSDVQLIGQEHGRQGYAEHPVDLGYTALATWVSARWYGAPTSAIAMRRTLATRLLRLPEGLDEQWRISADNCLVFGASLFGARKYFLPTGSVDYRIHADNGWWHNRASAGQFPALYRSRHLINHYAQVVCLDIHALELVRHEFKTREPLPWAERCLYARIAMRSPAPWWKRLERALNILLPRRRGKARAP